MMSLTEGLPNAVTVNGRSYLLNTDFKVWLNFPKCEDFRELFASEHPCIKIDDKWGLPKATIDLLIEFYKNEGQVPRSNGSGVKMLDFDIDAELIYSAFMQQYGIDLFETDMHWHKFKSLINGITNQTLLGQVIGWRGSKDSAYAELRSTWSLPIELTEEEQRQMDEFNELWG